MKKILIVDDHAVVRQGVRYILQNELRDVEFGEAETQEEVLKKVGEQNWDLVILDIKLQGRSGFDLLIELKYKYPQLPVFVLSMYPEEQYAVRILKSGACGFMNKENAPEELARAVRRVLAGRLYVSPSLAEKLVFNSISDNEKPPHEKLSDREFQVMLMIASGKSLTEISEKLRLNVKTISTYRTRILEKMKMGTNAELTSYALKHDLIEIG
jgi:two-component system invasion response regulator UvrY